MRCARQRTAAVRQPGGEAGHTQIAAKVGRGSQADEGLRRVGPVQHSPRELLGRTGVVLLAELRQTSVIV